MGIGLYKEITDFAVISSKEKILKKIIIKSAKMRYLLETIDRITLVKVQPSPVVVLHITHMYVPIFLLLDTVHSTSCPKTSKSALHCSSSVSPSVPLIFTNWAPFVPSWDEPP